MKREIRQESKPPTNLFVCGRWMTCFALMKPDGDLQNARAIWVDPKDPKRKLAIPYDYVLHPGMRHEMLCSLVHMPQISYDDVESFRGLGERIENYISKLPGFSIDKFWDRIWNRNYPVEGAECHGVQEQRNA